MDKQTFDRGLEIRKSVLGAEFVEKSSDCRRFQSSIAGAGDGILLGGHMGT